MRPIAWNQSTTAQIDDYFAIITQEEREGEWVVQWRVLTPEHGEHIARPMTAKDDWQLTELLIKVKKTIIEWVRKHQELES